MRSSYRLALASVAAAARCLPTVDGRTAVAHMKSAPTDDDAFGPGRIREDGRKIHPSYLMQAKTPTQSKNEFDVLDLIAITPAEEAFRPMTEGGCSLLRR